MDNASNGPTIKDLGVPILLQFTQTSEVPMKGVFPTPDIVHFFNPTSDTEAKDYLTFDIKKSARHSTLCLQKAKENPTWGLDGANKPQGNRT